MGIGVFAFCIVSSAWYEIRHQPGGYDDKIPLILASYIMVFFTTIWWLEFLENAHKFISGYSVGAWYFDE